MHAQHRLLRDPVARITVKYLVHLPALYHLLPRLDVADDAQPFGPRRSGLFLPAWLAGQLYPRKAQKWLEEE